jgi:endonuclease/exonuclease/phosphatase family metal-dependent hydrolase
MFPVRVHVPHFELIHAPGFDFYLGMPRYTAALLFLTMVSCVAEDHAPDEALGDPAFKVVIPARGADDTLDVASWNIEFFGSTGSGPSNEPLQLANARDVIAGTDFDIWGLAEIVGTSQFNTLKSQLSGYSGFLANDPAVTSGSSFYSASEQKVGILFKSSVATLQGARLILTQNNDDFAGRPPLEVKLRVSMGGVTEDIVVIVLHAKAFDDVPSFQRRQAGAIALKSFIDSTYPTQKVIVVGDYNDDVDTSITPGQPSPYQNFVSDSGDYDFLTDVLSAAGQSSTVGFDDMIDHHLGTNEMAAGFISGTAQVYRVDQFIASYGSTTSDHFPVLTRYDLDGATPPPPPPPPGSGQLRINEILANEVGSSTAGEFVEIVNGTNASISLAGFTISDSSSVRHTFPAGSSIGAGRAVVVFAGASAIPGGLTNAVAASTGQLNLANGGDTVRLRNSGGVVVDQFTYSSSLAGSDGVSMNRSPDGSTGGFVLHNTLAGSASSAGKRVNGSAF